MTEETKREQTLLEAAKQTVAYLEMGPAGSHWCSELRAAIAREEALLSTPNPIQWMQGECRKATDRAQQAEADAAWHKAESARLSAKLAKRKAAVESTAPFVMWRERAEKAEAELAERRREGLESEKSKPQLSHPMDGGEITVMLNRAGVKATKYPPEGGAVDMTTAERVACLIDDLEASKKWLKRANEDRDSWEKIANKAETDLAREKSIGGSREAAIRKAKEALGVKS